MTLRGADVFIGINFLKIIEPFFGYLHLLAKKNSLVGCRITWLKLSRGHL